MASIAITVLLGICLCYISVAQGEDTMKMVERVMRTCRDRYKIQTSDIETAIKNKKLPQDEKGRGFLMCIIKEVGFNQLKNMIRSGNRVKGDMAALIELPEFEKELDETSAHMAIA
uniref:tRNA 5-methylaminomethyl-2-thiouridine biosynthesis bifunctional protein MnmC n=1 Tax=Lygus hesperus TaxID=30085 RepID=A0A0A9WL86_LYGHE